MVLDFSSLNPDPVSWGLTGLVLDTNSACFDSHARNLSKQNGKRRSCPMSRSFYNRSGFFLIRTFLLKLVRFGYFATTAERILRWISTSWHTSAWNASPTTRGRRKAGPALARRAWWRLWDDRISWRLLQKLNISFICDLAFRWQWHLFVVKRAWRLGFFDSFLLFSL